MSAESPGAFNQASSYGAEQTRRAIFSWAARTSANSPGIISGGLLSASDCQLSAPGSGLSVNVSAGEALIGGSEGGTQGGYYGRVSSTTNLALSTANPTNPRIDTVSLTIADAGYTEPSGVSGNALVPLVTTGTPTSGATLSNLAGKAALPASSLLLGYVLVPATATNIITADISNRATVVSLLTGTNYLRVPAATSALLTWGIFTTTSGAINNAGSGDWTLSGLGSGVAQLNYPTRATNPAVIATIDTAAFGNGYVEVSGISTSSATFTTLNDATAPPTLQSNALVSFIVVG